MIGSGSTCLVGPPIKKTASQPMLTCVSLWQPMLTCVSLWTHEPTAVPLRVAGEEPYAQPDAAPDGRLYGYSWVRTRGWIRRAPLGTAALRGGNTQGYSEDTRRIADAHGDDAAVLILLDIVEVRRERQVVVACV